MKVTVSNEREPRGDEIEYPCLMEFKRTGLIVLFSAEQKGITIRSGETHNNVGEYAEDWARSKDFTIYKGSITLENG